jgi:hypothetical protein
MIGTDSVGQNAVINDQIREFRAASFTKAINLSKIVGFTVDIVGFYCDNMQNVEKIEMPTDHPINGYLFICLNPASIKFGSLDLFLKYFRSVNPTERFASLTVPIHSDEEFISRQTEIAIEFMLKVSLNRSIRKVIVKFLNLTEVSTVAHLANVLGRGWTKPSNSKGVSALLFTRMS